MFRRRSIWPGRANTDYASPAVEKAAPQLLRYALAVTLLALLGCQPRRPDFLTRVREDCAAGDQWACDLIEALRHPQPARDGKFH
jgi:hypothetical protein